MGHARPNAGVVPAWALALLVVLGCGHEAQREAPPIEVPAPTPPSAAELTLAGDARTRSDVIERAARFGNVELRRLALRAQARQHDPSDESIALLRAGLRDTDPGVRGEAALGLGALGSMAPDSVAPALAGAIAAETDVGIRAWMMRDLGRLGTDDGLAALVPELRSDEARYRAAACLGIGEHALAGGDVSREIRGRLASRLDPSEPEPVRFACAYALARTPRNVEPDELRSEVVALGTAVADESARVRLYAYRALGRATSAVLEVVAHGTEDDDWQVRVQAFRALGQLALRHAGRGARVYARSLRAAFEALWEERSVRPGPPLHVFLTALGSAAPIARRTPIHDLAAELHEALRNPASRDHALAQCAAAELVDRSRGWPSRVLDCGGDEVEPWERQVREAEILGDLDGAESQRLVRLRRLFRVERPAVREATLAAAAKIVSTESTDLVLGAFEVDDAGVRAAALEALKTIASRRPSADVAPPPLPAAAVRDALRSAREATPDDELETLVHWIAATGAADARELAPEVRALAMHANRAVRDGARELLGEWEIELPRSHAAVEPLPASVLSDGDADIEIRLDTERGPVVISLRPEHAPTTVARFLALARQGYFDGLTFHRVVPAFVIQGGDPRGDGYGGPGWSQRCEDNRLEYGRGAVGMALAGRDTGGSQFFITHGPQPHLEGRYTIFGQVTEGMDNLDLIQAGDRIIRIELNQVRDND